MIERVGDDEVAFLDDRRGQRLRSRSTPTRTTERRLGADESAIAFSSSRWIVNVPQMKRTLAVPAPNRRSPSMPASTTLGLVAQAEVVVRREDQHFAAAFHLHARRLRRVEIVEPLVDAIGLELLDARLRARRECGVQRHGRSVCSRCVEAVRQPLRQAISKMTLPASPDLDRARSPRRTARAESGA